MAPSGRCAYVNSHAAWMSSGATATREPVAAAQASGFDDVVDARFSTIAALASLLVAVASAAASAWAVAAVFGLLAAGFALRALQGYRGR